MTDSERMLLLSLFDFDDKLSDNLKIKKLYSMTYNIEKNYKIFEIKKHNGEIRKVYSPNYYLKNIQRNILNKILYNKSSHKSTNAYCRCKGIKSNSINHVNKKIIVKLDIRHFFDNLSFNDVYNIYFSFRFSKRICGLLSYLSTYNDYLPQGAPTSSYLSNLILYNFDVIVSEWCCKNNITYTRYSDDMTFSMNKYNSNLIKFIRINLYKYGLELNNDKIHIIKCSSKQKVTGIIVNKNINTELKYRKKIRQEMYYIKKFGINSHIDMIKFDGNIKSYLKALLGKINFVLYIKYSNEFNEYKNYVICLLNNF